MEGMWFLILLIALTEKVSLKRLAVTDSPKEWLICHRKFQRLILYKGGPKVISCNETRYPSILLSYQVELATPNKQFPNQNDIFSVVVGQGDFCENPPSGKYLSLDNRSKETAPPMANCYNFEEGNTIPGMRCIRRQVVQYLKRDELPCIAVYCSNDYNIPCNLWLQGFWEISTIIYTSSASIPIGAKHLLILGENFPMIKPKVVCYSIRQEMPCSISEMNELSAALTFASPISEAFAGPMYVSLNLETHWSPEVQIGIVRLAAEYYEVVVLEVFGILLVVFVIVGANVCWKLWDIGFCKEGDDNRENDDVLSVTRELLEQSS